MASPAKNALRFLVATALFASPFAAGCGSGSGSTSDIDNGFESDDPTGKSAQQHGDGAGAADAGSATPGTNGGAKDDPGRTVQEADIISVDGNRLYALSRYGGLSIVDITDPDHMKLLGRKRTDGMPFEMYVANGRAYVMMNDFGRWVSSGVRGGGAAYYGEWVQASAILALDVTNPANITSIAEYDVPGSIADSRLVGDALYLVTYENGYCWRCNANPATVVTSFNVAGQSIAQVDQLAYVATDRSYSFWQRSVSATNERLYIAGPQWNWQPGTQNGSSVIQVVDITDPTGKMKKGADVPVAGQINSRWQMDEYAGVLRVVSQNGNGWGGNSSANPRVQTFTIVSSNVFTPLGQTEIKIPKPESLRSVRFDGVRGYAITAERKDPLFTIDLADPAHPKQAGELSMPGWIFYMEPRGDRLVGFGFDDPNNGSTPVAVSLFDVSDLTKPTMIKRVTFGSGWAQLGEDQNRIQKSVRVLDDQGLVLVPFASYGRWNGGSCTQPESGIQLIDYSRNDLVLRGLAPQYGLPRRALVANNRLLAVSDRNVTSFDIGSRDVPAKKGELDLSNPTYRMVRVNDSIASITNDWWTGEAMLSVTPREGADDAAVSGKLSLAPLAEVTQAMCSGSNGWTAWYDARLFASGDFVYLTVPTYRYDGQSRGGKVIVAAIDVSNPQKPALAGASAMQLTEHSSNSYYYGGYYGGFYDGYSYYSYYGGESGSLVGSGQAVVQLGTKLAYIEVDYEPFTIDLGNGQKRYDAKVNRKVHVVDFAVPTVPLVHAPVALPDSFGAAPLHLLDGVVMTSRWVQSPLNADKVRFYVDRVDIRGVAPVRLPSFNTPGSLVLADQASQRLVTVDYRATRTSASDWQSCQTAQGWRAYWEYDTHECVRVDRSFKLSDVSDTRVTLRQSFTPPSQNIGGVTVADDRIYVTHYPRYDYTTSGVVDANGNYTPPKVLEDGGMWVLGGVRDGNLSVVSAMTGDANWPLAATGTKVALYTQGGLAIYDTATPTPKLVGEANLRGWGYTSYVLMSDDRAICSLGEFGIQTVRY